MLLRVVHDTALEDGTRGGRNKTLKLLWYHEVNSTLFLSLESVHFTILWKEKKRPRAKPVRDYIHVVQCSVLRWWLP